jgi:fluoroacetyl-CoA thioesterase
MRVTAQVKLVAVEDRKLRFKVECRDEKEIIGTGFH